jgi:DNA-binding GntR family transcriptional regulator
MRVGQIAQGRGAAPDAEDESASALDLRQLLATAQASYTTKQELVASLLREAIVNGTLPPGQHLRQEKISSQFGLSWTPVREAFRILEAEGWVRVERHRGVIVSPLSLEDFEDVYLLRLANEPLAARLSAERMDPETIDGMSRLQADMNSLDLSGSTDWLRFLKLEREFHRTTYRAADRRRLYDLVMGLRDASERYLRASFVIADEPLRHRHIHQDLLAACRVRDGAAAEATMRRALQRVLDRMRPVLAGTLPQV